MAASYFWRRFGIVAYSGFGRWNSLNEPALGRGLIGGR
jgi:hypothetical protein